MFKSVLHGSFRKHFEKIKEAHEIFTGCGIEVVAPEFSEIVSMKDGFAILDSDKSEDPRMIELLYLAKLKKMGRSGFSYFVNVDGYLGKSASYELGIAQTLGMPCFFLEQPRDHPVYVPQNAVWRPDNLAEFIFRNKRLPAQSSVRRIAEKSMFVMWRELILASSVVAVGAIIEYAGRRKREKEILLVRTHKWGGRYSIVGEKVRVNERLEDALIRGIFEETGLKAEVGEHICTFDQIKNSGYFKTGVSHIFVDKVVKVFGKKVELNEEAQEFMWAPPRLALKELDIEPNAKHTLELYVQMRSAS
ncbi:MAG: NUDIX domain-containing protein [Patescibacteria group bacterium]